MTENTLVCADDMPGSRYEAVNSGSTFLAGVPREQKMLKGHLP